MGNLIKVLVENYDRSAKKYLLAHQEVCNISVDDLKPIIEQIQKMPDEKNQFPPRIVTDKYIFIKEGVEIWYRRNHINTLLGIPYEPEGYRERLKDINKLNDIFTSQKKVANWYIDHLVVPLFFFFYILIMTIRSFVESYTFNYYYIILFWIDFLGVFSIPYLLLSKMQEIPVRYSYPFKYDFQPLNVSYLIVILSLIDLFYFLGLFNYIILGEMLLEEFIMLLGAILILTIVGVSSLVYNHSKAKFSKEKRLHNLYGLIRSLPIEQKIYLSQFIVKAEDSKVTTTGILSKLIICISLLMSIIPFFTAL